VLETTTDLPRILQTLADHECEYVLIGGMAAVLHGSPHATEDCDIAIYFDAANRAKIVRALAPLNPRPLRWKGDEPYVWDEKSVIAPWTLLQTDAGRLDIVISLLGVESFAALEARSASTTLDGTFVRFASIDDLIAMKESTNRPKDQINLVFLRAVRQMREEAR
jgi:hypothetical protein